MGPDVASGEGDRFAVVCITDKNYLLPTQVMLSSLVRVLNPEVRVFVLSSDVVIEDFAEMPYRERVSGVVDYSRSEAFAQLRSVGFRGKTHVTTDAMAKLLLPFMFGEYERVLYLDVDMICCSSEINQLFTMDLGTALIAAVPDFKIARHSSREKLGISADSLYFNSGLVLFDIGRCLAYLTERLVIDRTQAISSVVRFVDQDTLNYVYRHKVHFLDLRFNVFANVHLGAGSTLPLEEVAGAVGESFMAYPSRELLSAMEARVVLHYTSSSKPWKTSCGHEDLWWRECEALGLRRRDARDAAPPPAPSRPFVDFAKKVRRVVKRKLRSFVRTTRALWAAPAEPVVAGRESVVFPVLLDLSWLKNGEAELQAELARLRAQFNFEVPATLLLDGAFAASIERGLEGAASMNVHPFVSGQERLDAGYWFATPLLTQPVAGLREQWQELSRNGTVHTAALGAWLSVGSDGECRVCARGAGLGAALLRTLGDSRYDDVLASLYRANGRWSPTGATPAA